VGSTGINELMTRLPLFAAVRVSQSFDPLFAFNEFTVHKIIAADALILFVVCCVVIIVTSYSKNDVVYVVHSPT